MTEEEKYAEEAKKNGVELPELDDITEKKPEEKKPEAPKDEPKPKEESDDDDEPEGEEEGEDLKSKPPAEKKRSIYNDYKDEKKDRKGWQGLAIEALKAQGVEITGTETAEQLREKFAAISKDKVKAIKDAETPEEKREALDEYEEFAKEIDADPKSIKKLRDLILKGATIPESLQKDLSDLKAWKESKAGEDQANAKENAKKQFEGEFIEALPHIKSFFPKASDDEMQAIKKELDRISHSDGWNDKSLKYIAFEHQDALSKLVSPKKRGMEGTERVDDTVVDTDFDPNADLSKMSAPQRAAWEVKYNAIMKKPEGLTEGSGGKKILI